MFCPATTTSAMKFTTETSLRVYTGRFQVDGEEAELIDKSENPREIGVVVDTCDSEALKTINKTVKKAVIIGFVHFLIFQQLKNDSNIL